MPPPLVVWVRIHRPPAVLILKIDEPGFINAADDRRTRALSAGAVLVRRPGRRVLIAVRPGLLGDLLARRFDRDTVEVVLFPGTDFGPGNARHFDVVVTTGIPPAHVDADAVLRLPDRLGHGDTASLVTGQHLQRVRIDGPGDVVALVQRVLARGSNDDE